MFTQYLSQPKPNASISPVRKRKRDEPLGKSEGKMEENECSDCAIKVRHLVAMLSALEDTFQGNPMFEEITDRVQHMMDALYTEIEGDEMMEDLKASIVTNVESLF